MVVTLVAVACSNNAASTAPSAVASAPAPASAGASAPASTEPSAAAWQPVYVDGKLQPLPDGFPNKSLTILNADEPGAPDGIYARHLQEALLKISPVDVEVLDRADFPTYGTWEALKFIDEQPGGPDGYMSVIGTVVGGAQDLLITPVADDLGVSLDSYNYVIATEYAPHVLIQSKTPKWGSTKLEDMVAYVKAHPGEVKYISPGPGSGRTISWLTYAKALGDLKFNYVVIDGNSKQLATVGSGEGDLALLTADVTLGGFQEGKVDVIMVTGVNPAPEPWPSAPIGDTVIPGDPFGVTRALAVPEDVPDLHRQWLFEFYKAGSTDPDFVKARTAIPGLTIVTLDREQARQRAETGLRAGEPVLEELGLLVHHVDEILHKN
jgi:tripartite-type tricarboxylate transporter receptor subunit TctC